MKILLLTLAYASVALASDVLEFTDSDFATKVAQHETILVEFFAPWCGHCKRLAPEYETAATRLKKNDPPVPLAKVDCTANTEVCGKYGVSGYPTLKIFKGGEMAEDYNGPRESDGIVKTMMAKAGPSSREYDAVEQVQKFLEIDSYGVLGFFDSKDSDLTKTFLKTADSMSGSMRFAHTFSEELAKKFKHKDAVVLYQPKILHSKFEDKEYEYDGEAKEYKLKSWLEEKSRSFCGHRTKDNASGFKKPLFVAYYDVDYVKNVKGTNYWRNRVMKVGKKVTDAGRTAYFAISGKDDMSFELSEFGVEGVSGDKPVVCALDTRDRKFKMEAEFSMDNFEKFINDVLDNKVEPYLKSEPVPEPNDEPVKVVVAKNFEEIVNDPERDVLIEFYAPWCGHCKSLAPKYDELAEKLKDETGITIAKMDATANDVPKPFEVQGFPTLYFAKKDKKGSPEKYQGGREVDDFINYLAKESTEPLSGYDRKGKKIKKKKTEL